MSSDSHLVDEYDEYNYDQDKLVNSGHSGKRTNVVITTLIIIIIIPVQCSSRRGFWHFCFFTRAGKNRSKKEASDHTNHFDPSGHSRKLSTKLQNTESNRKEDNLKPHPVTKKWSVPPSMIIMSCTLRLYRFFFFFLSPYKFNTMYRISCPLTAIIYV